MTDTTEFAAKRPSFLSEAYEGSIFGQKAK